MSKKRKIIDDESSIDSLESESELDLASDGADSGLDDSDEDDKISLKKSNMPTTPAMAVPRNEKTPIKTAQPSVSISSTTKTMTTHTKKVAAALPESSTSCAVNLASSSTPNAIDTLHSSMNIDITKGGPVTTEASAKKLLLEYFKKQNRPYSSIQVYDNLHHRIQKPVVERLLATLSSLSSNPLENDILCKEYGKAKIYYYNQAKLAEFSSFTDKQIAELDKELKSISAKVDEQRAKYKAIKAAVETLQREPTDAELDV